MESVSRRMLLDERLFEYYFYPSTIFTETLPLGHASSFRCKCTELIFKFTNSSPLSKSAGQVHLVGCYLAMQALCGAQIYPKNWLWFIIHEFINSIIGTDGSFELQFRADSLCGRSQWNLVDLLIRKLAKVSSMKTFSSQKFQCRFCITESLSGSTIEIQLGAGVSWVQ